MDIADHIASIRGEGELLARTAERIALDTPVPSCPGWRMRALLAHLGYVHRWAAGYVAQARTEMAAGPGDEEVLRLGPADDVLIGWFREGHANLVSVLGAADPAVRCWTFLAAPSPLAFWARRQAHETAIHRADAQLAAVAQAGEGPRPFGARFAADGVDELLMGFASRRRRQPLLAEAGPATLRFRAVDAAGDPDGPGWSWTVSVGAEQTQISRGLATPGLAATTADGGENDVSAGRYCEVSGPGSDLYLMLWNRQPADALDVRGDAALLDCWREQMHVRWR